MQEDPSDDAIDPRGLSVEDRTLWLIDRLEQVEALLMGVTEVQNLLIARLPRGADRAVLRDALTKLALSLPPQTLRSRPLWGAIGLLDQPPEEGGADE